MKIKALMMAAVLSYSAFMPLAHADTTKDMQTIAKAIGFVNGGPTGDVTVDIVYDSGNADSVAHADEVAGLLNGVGSKVKLTGKKVGAAGGASSKVIFITRGAGSQYGAALDKAVANGGITVSTDSACLGSGCVLVVKTEPSVDIQMSLAAAGKAGVEFASAFRMMITEK